MTSSEPRVPPPLVCHDRVWWSEELIEVAAAWSDAVTSAVAGFACLTTGSIGRPLPVYRTMAQPVETGPAPARAVDFPSQSRLICSRPLDRNGARQSVARRLPPRSRPRLLEQAPALPRLPSGKPGHLACVARRARSR